MLQDKRSVQPKDRRRFLKVKIKSLMEEARIIRKEENNVKNHFLREELHHHRVHPVRSAARHTHLAYGIIRGRKVTQIDSLKKFVAWEEVARLIKKYGSLPLVYPHGDHPLEELHRLLKSPTNVPRP